MMKRIFKFLIIIVFVISINAVYAQEVEEKTSEETLVNPDDYVENQEEDIIDKPIKQNEMCVIEDDANLLTEEEEKRLYDELMPLTEFGYIAFKSISVNNTTAASYAREYYHSSFGTASGTLFLIDMDNREIYIFSDGTNYKIVTSNKAYSITDNVYRYASRQEYYECASIAFKQIYALLNGYKIAEPMRYASDGFIAIILAAFINFFIVMYKSKIKKSSEKEILKGCKVKFDIKNIHPHQIGTRKVYSPRSESGGSGGFSGGGGGGFGGGGGGGGSSGGGGGHGF